MIRVWQKKRLPLIGTWLYRKYIRNLAARAADGDETAVPELAGLFSSATDPKARQEAGTGLCSLSKPRGTDALCHEALALNSPALMNLARECGYLPSDPQERAFFLFCTDPAGRNALTPGTEFTDLDLAGGYLMTGARVRALARAAARRNKACDILARALCSPGMPGPKEWSFDEWEIVVRGLSKEGRWADLWQYLVYAPLPLAVEIAGAIKEAGWVPPGDDRLIWEGIISVLPVRWNYPTYSGENLPVTGRPADRISLAAFSPDSSLLATGCDNGAIIIRRVSSTGTEIEIPAGPGPARFITFSIDNRFLVSCGSGSSIQCHELPAATPVWVQETGPGEVTAMCYSADGRALLAGTSRGTLSILDPRDGIILMETALHTSPVTCLTLTRDKTRIACGHADGTVSVTETDTRTIRHLPPASADPVRSIAFGPAGMECLVVHERALPVLWDAVNGTRIRIFSGHTGVAACCAIAAESGWFAIGSSDHTIRCWEWHKAQPATIIPLYNRHIVCCNAAPVGRVLAAGFNDGLIRLYQVPGKRPVKEIKGHRKTISSCTISLDGSRLATVSWDGTTKLWRLPAGEIVRTFDTHAVGIAALATPSQGSPVVAVTGDGIARIHNHKNGTLIRIIDLYTPLVRTVAVSPDGRYLACAGADGSLKLWDLKTGSLVSTAGRTGTSLRCCTFLSRGASLFTGGWDGRCRVFSIPECQTERTLKGHTSIITCCAASRDGSLVVTGSNDTTIRIWHGKEEEARTVLEGSGKEIGAVAISPDGMLLAAGGSDSIIRLYRLPDGEDTGEIEGNFGKVTTLSFDPEGSILTAGYDSGFLAYFTVHEKRLIRTRAAHTGAVTGVAVPEDGRVIITSGEDGLVQFHHLPVAGFLPGALLADLPGVRAGALAAESGPDSGQWAFLYRLLAARFRGEIQISPSQGTIGQYDIQITG
ncbi:MAG: hypothetical protein WC586_08720 [Methanoregula sp.]